VFVIGQGGDDCYSSYVPEKTKPRDRKGRGEGGERGEMPRERRKRRGRGERRKEREDRKRETTSPFIRRPAAAHTVPGPPGLQRLRQQFSRDFMNLV
jgi:hypothetical protein